MSIRLASLAVASFSLALVLGCSSSASDANTSGSSSGTSGQPASGTTLRGALTGATETGVLDLTLPSTGTTTKSLSPLADPPAANAVTGAITFNAGGGTITLTGTYDAATGNFTVSGGGYSLTGNLKSGVATGSYTGPKGAGQFTANATSAGAVTVYCGTFKDTSDAGTWNVACGAGGDCSGSYYSTVKKAGGTLIGKIAGATISFTDPNGKSAGVTGTIAGTAVTGTCKADGTCTFQGSVEACSK